MDNYHVLEIIGEGSFGKVYKGRKKFTGQVVALKFIPKVGKPEKELRNLRREIDIMRGLHHDNIIQMLDSFETDKEVAVVTDYAEGELFQILEDDGSLPEEQVQHIACQLISALYYLHSHRILHRDMKPQNILLGKGGIVKLCDFGFARAMSFNTLVLTSIKGTPLYMSPELVEEKPYDHTADLWALGCILYELFTGTPPFYTNSIFQLVSLIIKDPVKWPKNMSPVFKDFLQGLLTKNPRSRLSWPELLTHPFISDGVNVSEEDTKLPSPFTQPLTASMIMKKEQQAKEKAHPPGTSKILAKARRKAMEEEKKKEGDPQKGGAKDPSSKEAWGPAKKNGANQNNGGGNQNNAAVTEETQQQQQEDRPPTEQWQNTGTSKQGEHLIIENISPTPRPDRISKDYEKEYPSIEVEGRRTVRKSPDAKKEKKKNIENVKLEAEEVDSDDEWQGLIDATDQEADSEVALKLLKDSKFHSKLKTRLQNSHAQVLDGMLEGAARLKTVLRVVTNLVTLKCEVDLIIKFVKAMNLPQIPQKLLTEILDKASVRQQPWSQQILIDLVIILNAYFACEISWTDNLDKDIIQEYYDAILQFMSVLPKIMCYQSDDDLRLREQATLCAMYTCEVMERNKMGLATQYFTTLASKHTAALDIILECTKGDPLVLKKLTDLAEGNTEAAAERMEMLINICTTTLSAMVNIPLSVDEGADGRRKIAHYLGEKMSTKGEEPLTDEFLILMRHPGHCSNVLKVTYMCCQVSSSFCSYMSTRAQHMDSLMGILMGKVDVQDMEVNSVIETVIHIFSTIVIQLQAMPSVLSESAALMVSIFLESTIASHTAAAALLFSQMVYCGVAVEVQPEEMLQACLSVFTDLQQICVRCPFDYGVMDGLMLLLCEMLTQSEGPVAQLYIETGIWSTLWHRVAQALQVTNPETDTPIHDIETEAQIAAGFQPPDWTLVSPQGLMAVLQIAVTVFTKETGQCIPNLAVPDSVILLTTIHLLHKEFLALMFKGFNGDGPQLTSDMVLQVTQLCCFPFAVDITEELLTEVQQCLYDCGLLHRILHASIKYLKADQLEIPIGLLTRLVLGHPMFIDQCANAFKELKAAPFISSNCIQSSSPQSVVCDVLCICSHLARTSKNHIPTIKSIFQGSKGDYEPLILLIKHTNSAIRSRTCSLLGNMMKHTGQFYSVLKQRDKLLEGLIICLKDDDPNVRKGASYAIGNAAYHNSDLYLKLKPTIPVLIELLRDPISKTKANAASACGNMALHSNTLCAELKKTKVIQVLISLACNDQQHSVQISALLALRSLSQVDELKKEMLSQKAVDKLNGITVANTPRPSSTASRAQSVLGASFQSSHGGASSSSVFNNCSKLIRILQGKS